MKIATSTGGVGYAGRGVGKRRLDTQSFDDEGPSAEDSGADENLPSLAAFGGRTPPRGSLVNILA